MTGSPQYLAAAPSDSPIQSKEMLTRSLDHLLERYLILLDDHQKLRDTLTKHLSAGHLLLAQANFSNPNRIRYGQDYYDERMQASTLVSIDPSSTLYRVVQPTCSAPSVASNNDATVETSSNKIASDVGIPEQDQNKDGAAESNKKIMDPLKWTAVLATIPALASAEEEMRLVEIEVRRIRKKLKKAS